MTDMKELKAAPGQGELLFPWTMDDGPACGKTQEETVGKELIEFKRPAPPERKINFREFV